MPVAKATENTQPDSEPWPPVFPDISWKEDILKPGNLEELGTGNLGYVYRCNDLAYKVNCMQREYDMMKRAGDCAVKPVARVIELYKGRPVMAGLLMELGTPFDFTKVAEFERAAVKDEMIQLTSKLHKTYGVIHGDIKPSNMLRCKDGKLRFCDFDSARPIDEDTYKWEGYSAWQYLAPDRDYFNTGAAPTELDDDYALAICLWELYSGEEALIDELGNIEELLKERRTVDLNKVKDEDVRELIRGMLNRGGANV